MNIREANTKDLPVLQAIARKTFYETYASMNTAENMSKYLNEDLGTEKLRAELGVSTSKFFLFEKDNTVLAYTKLTLHNCSAWKLQTESGLEIERIYVDAGYQGKGIGKALLMHAEEVARNFLCNYIWLGVWQENEKAIKFYTQHKFEIVGRHIFKLGLDDQTDWLMAKAL